MRSARSPAISKGGRSWPSSRQTEWRALTKRDARFFPRHVRSWMLLSSSMTKRLRENFGQAVLVDLLKDERSGLYPDEKKLFRSRKRKGFAREVCLYSGKKKLLSARTVFLSDRLKSNSSLSSLGTKPLGELLFANGKPQWTLREYAQLRPKSLLFPLVRQCCGRHVRACWARRTMFLLQGEPLLVTEIFLPSMLIRRPTAHSATFGIESSKTHLHIPEEESSAILAGESCRAPLVNTS